MSPFITLLLFVAAALGVVLAFRFDSQAVVSDESTPILLQAAIEDSTDDSTILDVEGEPDSIDPLLFPETDPEGTGQTPEDLFRSPELTQPLTETEPLQQSQPFTAIPSQPTSPGTGISRPAVPFTQSAPPAAVASNPEDIFVPDVDNFSSSPNDDSSAQGTIQSQQTEVTSPPIPGLW